MKNTTLIYCPLANVLAKIFLAQTEFNKLDVNGKSMDSEKVF
jgi:hypothetical protein